MSAASASAAASAASASADVARRAAAFVRQLGSTLAASSSAALDAAAVRAHVAAVIEGLPTPSAAHKALRSYLLQAAHFEEAVSAIAQVVRSKAAETDTAAATAATTGSAPLFSHDAYSAALADIDERASAGSAAGLQSYLPLLLPSAAPSFVRPHLLRTLIAQAKALSAGRPSPQQAQHIGSTVAAFLSQGHVMSALALPLSAPASAECQHQIELQLRFVRALPLHHAACAAIAALIDRACVHLSSASSSALSTSTTRRYQFLLAALLLEEAKRRPRESWAQAEAQRTYVFRVRTVLRCIPHPQPFTVSLGGELMFLQAAFDGLKAFKAAEKSHRAALLAKQQKSTAASSSSSKRSRSRSRSPSLSALGSFHDVAFFHAPTFSALWHPLLADVLSALGAGGRKEGDVETELLRLAILVRSVASASLVSALLPLQSSTVALAAAFPSRPIPLSLRPALQRFGSGSGAVTQCGQLWSARTEASSKVAQLSIAQLGRVLLELEGEVEIDDEDDAKQQAAVGAEESDDDSSAEDDAAESSGGHKKARFDEFGVSRNIDAMFFLDSGAAAAASSAAAGGDDGAAATSATTAAADGDSDPAASRSVEASMSRILQSLPQSEPTQSTQLSKKQKAAADKAAAASATKAAEELTKSQQQQGDDEEEEAEAGVAPMQLDNEDEDAAAAAVKAEDEEEDAPATTKGKKKSAAAAKKSAAKSTKTQKEPEAAPAEAAPTRSKRAAKPKQLAD